MIRRSSVWRREWWEHDITADHKSLVLLLYRNVMKGLLDFQSVRRRSLIAYCRMAFRRRARATEKLLIDECIEEARRAVYVIQKHHNFTASGTWEYDSMMLPKDTGQNVKDYMENHYDPEVSRQMFQQFQDVQPGKEAMHTQGFGPTSGPNHHTRKKTDFKDLISDEDRSLRPPPPPTG